MLSTRTTWCPNDSGLDDLVLVPHGYPRHRRLLKHPGYYYVRATYSRLHISAGVWTTSRGSTHAEPDDTALDNSHWADVWITSVAHLWAGRLGYAVLRTRLAALDPRQISATSRAPGSNLRSFDSAVDDLQWPPLGISHRSTSSLYLTLAICARFQFSGFSMRSCHSAPRRLTIDHSATR